MHLVIVTSGSRGDVQPYLALALRAMAEGLRVTLATHEVFRAWVEGFGVPFRPLHGDPVRMLAAPGARDWLAGGSRLDSLRFAREFVREFDELLEGLLADLTTATADADIIVHGMVCLTAAQLHEARGTPVMGGWLAPLTPTGAFPAVSLRYRAPRSRWDERRNWASHVVGQQIVWQPSRRIVNRWRGTSLGIAPLPLAGPWSRQHSAAYPICYAWSPAVLPKPHDWPEWIAPTGWWFLDELAYQPTPGLSAFLHAGDTPVTIGFGSMTPQDSESLTKIVIDACDQAECRALLVQGWGSLGATALPSTMHVEKEVPHAWLFPRTSGIVHHGGAGTTGAAVRSGVPSLVVPLGFDQMFWGARLEAIGVSPSPIRRRDLTAPALAAALRRLRTDTALRTAASTLGAVVRAEDGTGTALARIIAHANRG